MQGPSIIHRALGGPFYYSALVTAPPMMLPPSAASQVLYFARPVVTTRSHPPSPSSSPLPPALAAAAAALPPPPRHPRPPAAAEDTSAGKRPSFSIEAILARSSDSESRRAPRDRAVAAWTRPAQAGSDSSTQEPGSAGYLRGVPPSPLMYPVSALGYYPCSCHGTVLRGRGDACPAHRAALHGPSARGRGSKSKRLRTIFTQAQLERLEKEFARQQYMVGTERYFLASSLHLTEAQVKVWFQNRRIKWRKQSFEQQQARLAKLGLAPLPTPTSTPVAAQIPGPSTHGGVSGSGSSSGGSGSESDAESERASPPDTGASPRD
ncbi:uncharacterized protein LOC116941276 [Petromyzon marinus]|uniref:Homeobox protein not2-like n=1 Tax=Petromyzon marinus TaxID=7757 RepID=A0AAJ7WS07_PETMA|nr:homeobox protein not2-like [Petromyzon marinus]